VIYYDILTKKHSKKMVYTQFSFPHNYQSIQLPNNQVFIVGGGAFDAEPMPSTMT
jgi:hypothetical protein